MWQLRHEGKVVAEHSTRIACFTEAVERDLIQVVRGTRYMSPNVHIFFKIKTEE